MFVHSWCTNLSLRPTRGKRPDPKRLCSRAPSPVRAIVRVLSSQTMFALCSLFVKRKTVGLIMSWVNNYDVLQLRNSPKGPEYARHSPNA
jgi:hypothetical protein